MKDDPSALNELASVARPTIRAQLWWALPAMAALLVAGALRYLVIEPAAIAHACDPAPWSGWCALRSGLVRTFSTQGLGWLALAAGVVAAATRRRVAARLALTLGAAGLVLYCFEPAAVGTLLGVLTASRLPARGR